MRIMIFLLAAAAAITLWYYPQLPDTVASHFDAAGEANGWMDRESFMLLYAGLLVFLAAVFTVSAWLMTALPDSMINVPNKKFWFALERKEESMRFLSRTMYHMGYGTLIFLILMITDTMQANLAVHPKLSPMFWPVFILYFGFIGWLIIRLFMRFSKQRNEASA